VVGNAFRLVSVFFLAGRRGGGRDAGASAPVLGEAVDVDKAAASETRDVSDTLSCNAVVTAAGMSEEGDGECFEGGHGRFWDTAFGESCLGWTAIDEVPEEPCSIVEGFSFPKPGKGTRATEVGLVCGDKATSGAFEFEDNLAVPLGLIMIGSLLGGLLIACRGSLLPLSTSFLYVSLVASLLVAGTMLPLPEEALTAEEGIVVLLYCSNAAILDLISCG
jgi:hypothetical protein